LTDNNQENIIGPSQMNTPIASTSTNNTNNKENIVNNKENNDSSKA